MAQSIKKSIYLNSDFSGNFSAANNQVSAADITNLIFDSSKTKGFVCWLSVYIIATSNLAEIFELRGIHTGTDWLLSQSATGQTSNVVFTVTSTGQVQYTSSNISGFTSDMMSWKGYHTAQTSNAFTPAISADFVTTINNQTGTTYTITTPDMNSLITFSNSSTISLTIPIHSVVDFPVGARVDIQQTSTGAVTISGAGVTINSKGNYKTTNGQWVGVTLIQTAINVWSIFGDLV